MIFIAVLTNGMFMTRFNTFCRFSRYWFTSAAGVEYRSKSSK